MVEYNPGETMTVPYALSRQFELEEEITKTIEKQEKGRKIKEGKSKKHMVEKMGSSIGNVILETKLKYPRRN